MKKLKLCKAEEIPVGKSRAFLLQEKPWPVEGFVAHLTSGFVAYLNRCAHMPLPLDFGDGDFFSEDGKYFLCRNHGALFTPQTGECVDGPCAGQSLEKLQVEVKDGELICIVEKESWGK